jgi:hypothetical protein
MSRPIADTVTMKDIEILRAWVTSDGHLQIQVGAHPRVSDERREQCAREVADAILGIFDEDIPHGFRHLDAFIDIRH